MYLLFREKDWEPSRYYNLGPNEKRIVAAFLYQQADDEEKERRKAEKAGRS